MKMRWYLLTLIVSLTLLGLGQQEFNVPNQEIVVQFSNDEISSEDRALTIAELKSHLQLIGASHIKVKEEFASEKLVISYYSTTDLDDVKSLLSKEFDLSGTDSNLPDEKSNSSNESQVKDYYLDVFELRDTGDYNPVNNGLVVDINSENDRFNKPENVLKSRVHKLAYDKSFDDVAYAIHYQIALIIEQPSFSFPEVRAGPLCS